MKSFPTLDINSISRYVHHTENRSFGLFKSYQLDTALQPVYSFSHKRIVGYEALVRGRNSPINLGDLFSPNQDEAALILIDRLCRYIHVRNFMTAGDDINWLFLNICPQVATKGRLYGTYFGHLLETFSLEPHRVVIEIVENPVSDQIFLSETVEYYKSIGCLVAIDDFGAGHSNFDRIWSLTPDIVKLDRAMIVRAAEQKKIRQLLQGIVSLLHQAGCLVLTEGVETEEQAMIAIDSDADFVQGFFFAKPTTNYKAFSNRKPLFELLFEKYKAMSGSLEKSIDKIYTHYYRLYQKAAEAIQGGVPLPQACAELIADKLVERCYLLMPSGIQIGHTIVSENPNGKDDIRFRPIRDANSADWFRRHYLKRAIVHPGQLHISRPYLSITGAHMCLTLSMMFPTEAGNRVFCCDLNWE